MKGIQKILRTVVISSLVSILSVGILHQYAHATTIVKNPNYCASATLRISVGKWFSDFAPAGLSVKWLPITISHRGSTCNFGGNPIIFPIGLPVRDKVLSANDVGEDDRTLTLSASQNAYTYLKLVHPNSPLSSVKRWSANCKPSVATSFIISIKFGTSEVNKRVNIRVPEVCTTGYANDLFTSPFDNVATYR